jgi:hypothetical protein
MEQKTLFIVLGIGAVCLVLCAGVGGFMVYRVAKTEIDRDERQQDLEDIAVAMQDHDSATGRTPANLMELAPYLANSNSHDVIRNGEVQVVWSAARSGDQPGGASNVICAWETKANSDGKRLVVFMDGTVAELDESVFQTTPKAVKLRGLK